MSDPVEPDPREQFYVFEEQFRESIRRTLEPLSDDELVDIYALFHTSRLADVPLRYQSVTFKVRAAINVEQRRRQRQETASA